MLKAKTISGHLKKLKCCYLLSKVKFDGPLADLDPQVHPMLDVLMPI